MDVQTLLLAGQVLVVALVYLFVWRIIRSARGSLANAGRGHAAASGAAHFSDGAQDSTIIPAAAAAAARSSATTIRLVVLESSVLRAGVPFTVGGGLSIGRSSDNDVVLDETVVSGRHVRVASHGAVHDEGSTNGTFINGQQVQSRAQLRPGDVLQVGSTVFRYEASA